MANSSSPIQAMPGIIVAIPHIPEMSEYMDTKEAHNQDQTALVLEVGGPDISPYHPDVKITTPVKPGDVIFHTPQYHAAYKELTTGQEYKLIKFMEVKGILRVKAKVNEKV